MPSPVSIILRAVVEEALRWCGGRWKSFGTVGDLLADLLQLVDVDAGLAAARIVVVARRP